MHTYHMDISYVRHKPFYSYMYMYYTNNLLAPWTKPPSSFALTMSVSLLMVSNRVSVLPAEYNTTNAFASKQRRGGGRASPNMRCSCCTSVCCLAFSSSCRKKRQNTSVSNEKQLFRSKTQRRKEGAVGFN